MLSLRKFEKLILDVVKILFCFHAIFNRHDIYLFFLAFQKTQIFSER